MMYRFFDPPRPERKTISVPSGENEGKPSLPGSWVTSA